MQCQSTPNSGDSCPISAAMVTSSTSKGISMLQLIALRNAVIIMQLMEALSEGRAAQIAESAIYIHKMPKSFTKYG